MIQPSQAGKKPGERRLVMFEDYDKIVILLTAVKGICWIVKQLMLKKQKTSLKKMLTHHDTLRYIIFNTPEKKGAKNMATEYLTEKEILEWLKVSRSAIIRWRKQGMPFIKIERSIRFDRDKVKAWMDSKLVENEGPK